MKTWNIDLQRPVLNPPRTVTCFFISKSTSERKTLLGRCFDVRQRENEKLHGIIPTVKFSCYTKSKREGERMILALK